VARTFSYTQAWVSEGGKEFENFSKKYFLNFEWSKTNFTTFDPPQKNVWKYPLVPPWKNSFRRPCTQACKMTPFW